MFTKFGTQYAFRMKNKSCIVIFEIFIFWANFGADRAQKLQFFRFFVKKAKKLSFKNMNTIFILSTKIHHLAKFGEKWSIWWKEVAFFRFLAFFP